MPSSLRLICTRSALPKPVAPTPGRPPYDPAALLKLYLYNYLHRIRSSRLLAAETTKRWMDCTHFTLKGLEKVRAEWNLITLAYNLKRVLNLVSFEKLIAVVA